MPTPPTRQKRTNAPRAALPDACPRCRFSGRVLLTWRHRVERQGQDPLVVEDPVYGACSCARGGLYVSSYGTVEVVRDRLLARADTVEVILGERRVVPAAPASAPLFAPPPPMASTGPDVKQRAAGDTPDD